MTSHIVQRAWHDSDRTSPQQRSSWAWQLAVAVLAVAILVAIAVIATHFGSGLDATDAPYLVT